MDANDGRLRRPPVVYRIAAARRQARARSGMNAGLAAALPNWVYHGAQATVVSCVLTPRHG